MTAEKLSATKLARKYNTSASEVQRRLVDLGYIEDKSGLHFFTDLGRNVGGEYRKNHLGASNADGHMVWPANLPLGDFPNAKRYIAVELGDSWAVEDTLVQRNVIDSENQTEAEAKAMARKMNSHWVLGGVVVVDAAGHAQLPNDN